MVNGAMLRISVYQILPSLMMHLEWLLLEVVRDSMSWLSPLNALTIPRDKTERSFVQGETPHGLPR